MVATLVTPQELKRLPPPPVAKPRPKIVKPRRQKSPASRIMHLPRLTREELKNMRIHGGLAQGSPRTTKKTVKNRSSARKPVSLAAKSPIRGEKGGGSKTPIEKNIPITKGPGYSGKKNPSLNGNKKPGTRLVGPNLFDPGIMEQVAQNDLHRKKTGSTKNGITFDAADSKYFGYMRLLRIKIESIWKYPSQAQERRLQGDLEISFTINKDGTLAGVEVVRGSGYPILDEAAVQALRDGVPYWPLPTAWGKKSLTIDGHFRYSLYGGPQLW